MCTDGTFCGVIGCYGFHVNSAGAVVQGVKDQDGSSIVANSSFLNTPSQLLRCSHLSVI